MHACIRIRIRIYIYTFQCICIVQTTLLLDLGFHLFWKVPVSPEFAAKSLPHHLRRSVSREKGGSAKDLASKPLGNPSICQVDDRFIVLLSTCQFPNQRESRMFKYIDVLAAEILGTIVWHICFHETRAIQAQESRLKGHRSFSHVSVHNYFKKKINKVNHEIQVS